MKQGFLIVLLLCIAASAGMAQDVSADPEGDSLHTEAADTVALKSYATRYDPRKALLYAAIVPGSGQIYNKKYWKLPLVYGGFIALGYAINFYQTGYVKYKQELYYNLENGYPDDGDIRPGDVYSTSNYRKIVDQYKRQRDFMMILMGGMYLLQIVDAHVDAHLKEFDLNPSLQVSIRPTVEQSAWLGNQSGISIIIKF
ncbi:MAG TPA: DUF5683 domain-containing protein [Chryseolinea sp.]|nr:DUF5683 domain-containing protein [Chryseolinea sp.]